MCVCVASSAEVSIVNWSVEYILLNGIIVLHTWFHASYQVGIKKKIIILFNLKHNHSYVKAILYRFAHWWCFIYLFPVSFIFQWTLSKWSSGGPYLWGNRRRSGKLKRTPAGQTEKDEDVTASLSELNKFGSWRMIWNSASFLSLFSLCWTPHWFLPPEILD